jgi:hypothetical protein
MIGFRPSIAIAVRAWEKLPEPDPDDYPLIKACYLLGLAVGLKYAREPEKTADDIVAAYKKHK